MCWNQNVQHSLISVFADLKKTLGVTLLYACAGLARFRLNHRRGWQRYTNVDGSTVTESCLLGEHPPRPKEPHPVKTLRCLWSSWLRDFTESVRSSSLLLTKASSPTTGKRSKYKNRNPFIMYDRRVGKVGYLESMEETAVSIVFVNTFRWHLSLICWRWGELRRQTV